MRKMLAVCTVAIALMATACANEPPTVTKDSGESTVRSAAPSEDVSAANDMMLNHARALAVVESLLDTCALTSADTTLVNHGDHAMYADESDVLFDAVYAVTAPGGLMVVLPDEAFISFQKAHGREVEMTKSYQLSPEAASKLRHDAPWIDYHVLMLGIDDADFFATSESCVPALYEWE